MKRQCLTGRTRLISEFPYYDKKKEGAERYGKYGEIMPEEEFLLLVQACDMFEVVRLDKAFVEKYKETFAKDPVISDDIVEKIHEGVELSEIETRRSCGTIIF